MAKTEKTEADGNATDLARILALFNDDDAALQEQGFETLLASDSQDIWNAIMVGANFTEKAFCKTVLGFQRINTPSHKHLKGSNALTRAMLSSPFYDYSDIKELQVPTSCGNLDFSKLTSLQALSLEFNSAKPTCPRGLSGLRNLNQFNFVFGSRWEGLASLEENGSIHQSWLDELNDVETVHAYGVDSFGIFPLKLLESLPNLKHFHAECRIDYEGYADRFNGRLEICVPDGPLKSYLPCGSTNQIRADLVQVYFSWTEMTKSYSTRGASVLDLSQVQSETYERIEVTYTVPPFWLRDAPNSLLISHLNELSSKEIHISGNVYPSLYREYEPSIQWATLEKHRESVIPEEVKQILLTSTSGITINRKQVDSIYGKKEKRINSWRTTDDHRFFSWKHLFVDMANTMGNSIVKEVPDDYFQKLPLTIENVILNGKDNRIKSFKFLNHLQNLESIVLQGFSKLTSASFAGLYLPRLTTVTLIDCNEINLARAGKPLTGVTLHIGVKRIEDLMEFVGARSAS